ncbi:MAG: helix-turn-helix transcriptional regulator [Pleurocapsa sp. MO_226.B13]|nr:helix-turn-helix transcriptional regulator [Pleurocapsa sp. MO_226.B13]
MLLFLHSHIKRASKWLKLTIYVLQQRVAKAKQLLKQRDLPMVEIALMCGFSSQSAFSRTFSRCVGTSPRKYRQEL